MKKTFKNLIALVAVMVFALAVVTPAYANEPTFVQTDQGILEVSDDVTELKVKKLDADTGEFVKGATMQIIDTRTDTIVDQWVTTDAIHENRKKLDVGVRYILREYAAPDGYSVAKDTEFEVYESETQGIQIISGDNAELTQSTTINLYDKKGSTTRQISVYKSGSKTTSKVKAPQTGDETPLFAVSAAVVASLVGISVIQVIKKRQAKNEQ